MPAGDASSFDLEAAARDSAPMPMEQTLHKSPDDASSATCYKMWMSFGSQGDTRSSITFLPLAKNLALPRTWCQASLPCSWIQNPRVPQKSHVDSAARAARSAADGRIRACRSSRRASVNPPTTVTPSFQLPQERDNSLDAEQRGGVARLAVHDSTEPSGRDALTARRLPARDRCECPDLCHPRQLSAHKGTAIRQWAARNNVELCFRPTYASWASPIEAHFGPLRTFVIAGSDHQNHVALGRHLHQYLRWRNTNARRPWSTSTGPVETHRSGARSASGARERSDVRPFDSGLTIAVCPALPAQLCRS
jgi:hypothetical protein